jgi:hypothetical protein
MADSGGWRCLDVSGRLDGDSTWVGGIFVSAREIFRAPERTRTTNACASSPLLRDRAS